MLTQSKYSKYLLYAIGEISLVMIGILLALQVNNWNEDRKATEDEKTILSNLHTEFKTNLTQLKVNIVGTDRAISACKVILKQMNKTSSILYNNENIDSLLRRTITIPYWFPTSLAMNDLISSGKIVKLTSNDFRKVLYNYNAQLDQINNQEKLSSRAYNFYLEYIKKNGGLRQIDNSLGDTQGRGIGPSIFKMDNSTLLEKIEFENALDDYFEFISLRKENYERAAEIMQNIVDQSTKKAR